MESPDSIHFTLCTVLKKDFTAAAGFILLEDRETGGFKIYVTDILAFKVSGLGLEEGQAI